MAGAGAPMNFQDLIIAGDDTTWAPEDYIWDPFGFRATKLQDGDQGVLLHDSRASDLNGAGRPLQACRASSSCALHSLAGSPGVDILGPGGLLNFCGHPAQSPWKDAVQKPDGLGKVLEGGENVSCEPDKEVGVLLCQVESCRRELSGYSAYHKRCRICEEHAKELVFIRRGRQQRFCQQCGRCHDLAKFDGNKRSCKSQLAKHNARRRRPKESADEDILEGWVANVALGGSAAADGVMDGGFELSGILHAGESAPGLLEALFTEEYPEMERSVFAVDPEALLSMEAVQEGPEAAGHNLHAAQSVLGGAHSFGTMDAFQDGGSTPSEAAAVTGTGQQGQRGSPGTEPAASRATPKKRRPENERGDMSASEEEVGSRGRVRGGSSASQPLCQVEDCRRNLAHLSTYHQRCRICELHIKLPVFQRRGKQQRFCQQCGRCHDISKFEGTKRSCKSQLAKHNARRRRRKGETAAASGSTMPVETPVLELAANMGSEVSVARRQLPPRRRPDKLAEASSPEYEDEVNPVLRASKLPRVELANSSGAFGLHPPLDNHDLGPYAGGGAFLGGDLRDESPCTFPLPLDIPNAADASSLENYLPHANPNHSLLVDPSWDFMAGLGSTPFSHPAIPHLREPHPPPDLCLHPEAGDVRLDIKMLNRTPDHLPPNLSSRLQEWLELKPPGATCSWRIVSRDLSLVHPAGLFKGQSCILQLTYILNRTIQPGCVHLTLDLTLEREAFRRTARRGISAVVRHLESLRGPPWDNAVLFVQIWGHMAIIKDSQVTHCFPLDRNALPTGPVLPFLQHVVPSVLEQGPGSSASPLPRVSSRPVTLQLRPTPPLLVVELAGHNIVGPDCRANVRFRGRYLPVQAEEVGPQPTGDTLQLIRVTLPDDMPAGLAWLEVQRGGLLGPALPLLVLPRGHPGLAEEVMEVLDACSRAGWGEAGANAAVVDLGVVVDALGGVVTEQEIDRQPNGSRLVLTEAMCSLAWRAAVRLLALAVTKGLPKLARYLGEGAAALKGLGVIEAVADAEEYLAERGAASLADRAGIADSEEIYELLDSWAVATQGYSSAEESCAVKEEGSHAPVGAAVGTSPDRYASKAEPVSCCVAPTPCCAGASPGCANCPAKCGGCCPCQESGNSSAFSHDTAEHGLPDASDVCSPGTGSRPACRCGCGCGASCMCGCGCGPPAMLGA